jgi:hypothetical protein
MASLRNAIMTKDRPRRHGDVKRTPAKDVLRPLYERAEPRSAQEPVDRAHGVAEEQHRGRMLELVRRCGRFRAPSGVVLSRKRGGDGAS